MGFVFEPLTLVGLIVYLVWQCRSAKVAAALGYPARRSPLWGAWSWVVPIVNSWMPYQAVRDCLPPGHALRPTILRTWLLVLVVGILGVPVPFTLAEAPPVGIPLFVVVMLALWGAVLLAQRIITTIGQDHQAAVAQLDAVAGRLPG